MENLSKLSAEDLKKLQKGILEKLSRRDNEAWNIAADNFKKAYDELMRIGFGTMQVEVGVTTEEEGWHAVEHVEILDLIVNKEKKTITFDVEEIVV